jgi:hypothetical protein
MSSDYLNDFLLAFVDKNFQIKESVFGKVALFVHRTAEMQRSLFAHRGVDTFNAWPFNR